MILERAIAWSKGVENNLCKLNPIAEAVKWCSKIQIQKVIFEIRREIALYTTGLQVKFQVSYKEARGIEAVECIFRKVEVPATWSSTGNPKTHARNINETFFDIRSFNHANF